MAGVDVEPVDNQTRKPAGTKQNGEQPEMVDLAQMTQEDGS